MSFLSLVLALVLEHLRPLIDRRVVFVPIAAYAGLLERHFDAGEAQQGAMAWLLAVVPLVLASWAVYAGLAAINPLLGLAFNVTALYLTMGFRHHSHFFSAVQRALKEGDLGEARRMLGEWRGHPCDGLSASEVARLAIEGAVLVSHRPVFGGGWARGGGWGGGAGGGPRGRGAAGAGRAASSLRRRGPGAVRRVRSGGVP